MYTSGRASSYEDGVKIARESIASGGAKAAFEGFRDVSRLAMGEDVNVKVVEDDGGVAAKNGEVKAWLKANKEKSGEKVPGTPVSKK